MKKYRIVTEHTGRARTLRQNSTEVEKRLWHRLRDRQLHNHKFRRQYFANGFYLDFACEEQMLAIELDGGQHNDDSHHAQDQQRSQILAASGWRIIRFWNHELMENMEGVLEAIAMALNAQTLSPHPNPLPAGEGITLTPESNVASNY
jgi:adenine-specific DNA-methyltransferase